ncbi:MAG: TonB-dependent receptor plug domain-containing protein, partial [Methylococcaceae bacterium]
TTSQNIESSTASKYSQRNATASSAMRIVTAEDIRTYGYRTLAEVLRSLPGVYITSLRDYSYIGVRGFGRPGDYNSRVLLLIDGERINENIYDGAYIGNESLVDVDLIDRVEYAPGAGSAIYGNNAFFAVINVLTKRGSDYNGGQLSGEYGGFDTYKGRGTYGKRFDNGADLLLSANGFNRDGQERIYFKQFDTPEQNNGVAENLDYDHYHSAFAKLSYEALRIEGGYIDRKRGVPTGFWDGDLNDPINSNADSQAYVAINFDDAIAKDWRLNGRLGYHHYEYDGLFSYQKNYQRDYIEHSAGDWWNGEIRLQNTSFDNHRLQFGAEIQHNFQQLQQYSATPDIVYFDENNPSIRYGLFLQDEIRLLESLNFTAGVRYDYNQLGGSSVNPRVGLAWQPFDASTVKLVYGSAFRAPNTFELYYDFQKGDLKPETIKSLELGLEHFLTPSTRLSASFYHNWISNLISETVTSDGYVTLINAGHLNANGMELEAEQRFSSGVRLNLSYSLQRLQDEQDSLLTNSPEHLVKLHLSTPLGYKDWIAGLETLYMSERLTRTDNTVSDHIIGNLSISGSVFDNVQTSFSVYNLFDQQYSDPAGDGYVQDRIPQDGVSFRLKLSVGF